MVRELDIGDLDVTVAPAGMSDAVGGGPCVGVFVILMLWPS